MFVDTQKMDTVKKNVKPVAQQAPNESRFMWKEVTAGLKWVTSCNSFSSVVLLSYDCVDHFQRWYIQHISFIIWWPITLTIVLLSVHCPPDSTKLTRRPMQSVHWNRSREMRPSTAKIMDSPGKLSSLTWLTRIGSTSNHLWNESVSRTNKLFNGAQRESNEAWTTVPPHCFSWGKSQEEEIGGDYLCRNGYTDIKLGYKKRVNMMYVWVPYAPED